MEESETTVWDEVNEDVEITDWEEPIDDIYYEHAVADSMLELSERKMDKLVKKMFKKHRR